MKVINNFKVLGIVSILILSLGFIAGCSSKNKVSNTIQQSEETKGYENIDGKQTEKLLNSDKDVLIIDVRSEYEYEKGHLLNAINLPYDDDFKSELNEIIDYKDKIVFINSVVNLSVDCDCCATAKAPCMKDIGILASLDPVALDQACIDLIYNSTDPGRDTLVERIESRNGLLILESAEKQQIGSREYELIKID